MTASLPSDWADVMNAPAFVVHLPRDKHRKDKCMTRLKDAGYRHVVVVDAVDGYNQAIAQAHNVRCDMSWMVPKGAGCMLSHLNVWKHIIENHIPYATIFEDDCVFHSDWHQLAQSYYHATPKSADVIYMGHHCGNVFRDKHVVQVPVYCLNAVILTLQGAKKMYQMMTQYPYDDNHAIDMMLVRLQSEQLYANGASTMPRLEWYVWNSEMFPDSNTSHLIHPDLRHKDKGLVFQEWMHW